MAGMKQRGRLAFCEHGVRRVDYAAQLVMMTAHGSPGAVRPLGWAALAPCILGNHYLAPDPTTPGRVVECAATVGDPLAVYLWPDVTTALAAVEQLARQQAEPIGDTGGEM